MSALSLWAIAVFCAALVLALTKACFSQSAVFRTLKIVAALYLILSIANPIVDMLARDYKFDFAPQHNEQSAQYDAQYDERTLEYTAERVCEYIRQELALLEIEPVDISASVNISQQYGIYCDSITIRLAADAKPKEDEIARRIAERFGAQPQLDFG